MTRALMMFCKRHRPHRLRRPGRAPRPGRRGLGLADALLAVIVLGVLGTMGWRITSDWIDRRLLANEGRALATLARAGRLYVERDPAARAPAGSAAVPVGFNDLVAANLRGPGDPTQTPARRTMELWLWEEAPDRVLVLARARGDTPHANRYTPDAIDGVPGLGVVVRRGTQLQLAGPDVTLDFTRLNTADPTFARAGDLFALAHVFGNQGCGPYLSRQDGTCATMAVPLNMGNNDITGLAALTGASLTVGTVEGDVALPGDPMITGSLTVEGDAAVDGSLRINGTGGNGGYVRVGADISVGGELEVNGRGEVGGGVNTTRLEAKKVQAGELFSSTGEFNDLTVKNLTVGTCTGCTP